jgi:hypothetical protein
MAAHPAREGHPHRDPASLASALATLAGIAGAFGGQPAIASVDLLARLAAADPARYGGWDTWDLAGFLRPHGVRPRIVSVPADGQRRKVCGYRLDEITTVITELTAGAPARQAA